MIAEIASEAFMPLAYGGGINSVDKIKSIFNTGVEKVVINTAAINQKLITQATNMFGNQSIVVSIDVKKNIFDKYLVHTNSGTNNTKLSPVQFALDMQNAGAGEIFLNSIDRDGTYSGYDLELIKQVTNAVSIPVIACGGASDVNDFAEAVKHGASAVSAGSMFVFYGTEKGVLINFPSQDELKKNFIVQ